jgi:hypothetical protein
MPEDTQLPPPPTPFDIGEEFGTAKKDLPPIRIVLIGVALVIVVAAIVAFVQRPQAQATGSIDDATGVEIPNQNSVMAAINVSFQNHGEKPFWIHAIKVDIDTGSGTLSDDAASPVDFQRYYQAFPALKRHALSPLEREAKIDPGGKTAGTIIVSFPITSEAFANRKSLKVTIEPYDQPVPLVMVK